MNKIYEKEKEITARYRLQGKCFCRNKEVWEVVINCASVLTFPQ